MIDKYWAKLKGTTKDSFFLEGEQKKTISTDLPLRNGKGNMRSQQKKLQREKKSKDQWGYTQRKIGKAVVRKKEEEEEQQPKA